MQNNIKNAHINHGWLFCELANEHIKCLINICCIHKTHITSSIDCHGISNDHLSLLGLHDLLKSITHFKRTIRRTYNYIITLQLNNSDVFHGIYFEFRWVANTDFYQIGINYIHSACTTLILINSHSELNTIPILAIVFVSLYLSSCFIRQYIDMMIRRC